MKIGFCPVKFIVQSGCKYIFNQVDDFEKKTEAQSTQKKLCELRAFVAR
jgi:hypothetical protein